MKAGPRQQVNLLDQESTMTIMFTRIWYSHLAQLNMQSMILICNRNWDSLAKRSTMLMYEPGFEKLTYQKENMDVTSTQQVKIPMDAIFRRERLRSFQQSRNSRQSISQIQNSIQTYTQKRQPSQSFYTESNSKDPFNRPSTSYIESELMINDANNENKLLHLQNASSATEHLRPLNIQSMPNTQQPYLPSQKAFLNDPLIMSEQNNGRNNTFFTQPRSLQSRKFAKRNQQLIDLKKSVTLLQAYGEYERFLQMSKQYMKDKGIVLKKNLRKKKRRNIKKGDFDSNIQDQNQQPGVDPNSLSNPLTHDSIAENYSEINKILDQKLQSNEVGSQDIEV